MKNKKKLILIYIIILLSILLVNTADWFLAIFDGLSIEEILFHLKVPLTGSNNDFFSDFLKGPFLASVLIALQICAIVIIFPIIVSLKGLERKWMAIVMALSFFFLFNSIYSTYHKMGIDEYVKINSNQSTLYDEIYVHPDEDVLVYPETNRNLIYIFVESFESSFFSEEYGGGLQENPMEPLLSLTQEHTHFSHDESFGGAKAMANTTWTVAGMVSQTAGIHLKLPFNGNTYGEYSKFLPGVRSIGDVLGSLGYQQTLMIGSDADFAGRSNYFTQHGNYDIKDYKYALQQGLIPEDYDVWWGYEDEKLFQFAKDELLELASNNKPFNFTMLTADTHHVDGYPTEGMATNFDQQYSNVIFNTSQQLFDFVTWIQEQDFYENTSIIISADHLTMDAAYIEKNIESNYLRSHYNLIINPVVSTENTTNREFATFDMFPTTLASLGFEIKGDRLGIGTNLFSDTQTINEKYGPRYVNQELQKPSKFYNNIILFD